eukprot:2186644-Pyramimonas_sp.AAC.1
MHTIVSSWTSVRREKIPALPASDWSADRLLMCVWGSGYVGMMTGVQDKSVREKSRGGGVASIGAAQV